MLFKIFAIALKTQMGSFIMIQKYQPSRSQLQVECAEAKKGRGGQRAHPSPQSAGATVSPLLLLQCFAKENWPILQSCDLHQRIYTTQSHFVSHLAKNDLQQSMKVVTCAIFSASASKKTTPKYSPQILI